MATEVATRVMTSKPFTTSSRLAAVNVEFMASCGKLMPTANAMMTIDSYVSRGSSPVELNIDGNREASAKPDRARTVPTRDNDQMDVLSVAFNSRRLHWARKSAA